MPSRKVTKKNNLQKEKEMLITSEAKKENESSKISNLMPQQDIVVVTSKTFSSDDKDSKQNLERIVDRLDLQLLIAVIVLFVSAWVYLCDKICDFTESTPLNEQLCYILAHYLLTVSLILCIYISSIKGGYVLDKSGDVSDNELKYFKLFMTSWHIILLLGFSILLLANYIPWLIWVLILTIILCYEMNKLCFDKIKSFLIISSILVGFPVFISVMSNVIKEIDVITDKDYYGLDENVLITVNVKGYSCDYKLIKPGGMDLFCYSKYEKKKNMLIIPASIIKNNSLAIGVSSPASRSNFFTYPYYKFMGKDRMIEHSTSIDEKSIYYKKIAINIKP